MQIMCTLVFNHKLNSSYFQLYNSLTPKSTLFGITRKYPPAHRRYLLEVFDDCEDAQDLRQELTAFVDADVHFVSATLQTTQLLDITLIPQLLVKKLLMVMLLSNGTGKSYACIKPEIQDLISTNRSSVCNFILQLLLLRLHTTVFVQVQTLNPTATPHWKNLQIFHFPKIQHDCQFGSRATCISCCS